MHLSKGEPRIRVFCEGMSEEEVHELSKRIAQAKIDVCKGRGTICSTCKVELICPKCDLDDPIEDVNQDSARDQAENRRDAHD